MLKALEDKGCDLSEDLFIIYAREKYTRFLIGDGAIKNYVLIYETMMDSLGEVLRYLENTVDCLKRDITGHIKMSEEKAALYDQSNLKTFGDVKNLLIQDTTLKVQVDGYWYNPTYQGQPYESLNEEKLLRVCDDATDNYCLALKRTGVAPERITHKGCKYMPKEDEKELNVEFADIYIY